MEIVLILLGIICLLVALVGCVAPVLPGPPIAYLGLILLHLTDKVQFTTAQLLIWLAVVVVIQVLDYFIPMWGTRKMGGTRWGIWGCFLGTLAGLFFSPWGILIGPLAGAIIGELLAGKETQAALRAGAGAFLGFMTGVILKFVVCGWFIFEFVAALV